MIVIEQRQITCPNCRASTTLSIDCTAGDQGYFEDCQVCCAPIELNIRIDEQNDQILIESYRGNG